MLCYHHELLLLCWRRGLTLGTILATWPDTQPSPVNGEKRHNERNVTLRSKMHSAMHRHLRNHLIGERQNTTSGEKRMLLSMCMCVKMSLWQTFLLRFFSMLSTAKTCSPAAGSSIFRCERSGSSCRFSLCSRYPTPYPRFRAVFFFFSSCCSSDVKHKSPPPPPIFTATLPSLSPSERLVLQASWKRS